MGARGDTMGHKTSGAGQQLRFPELFIHLDKNGRNEIMPSLIIFSKNVLVQPFYNRYKETQK